MIETLNGHIDDLISWIWSYNTETNKSECDSDHLVLIDICLNLLLMRNTIVDEYSKFTKTLQNFISSRKFIQFIFKAQIKMIKMQQFFQASNFK